MTWGSAFFGVIFLVIFWVQLSCSDHAGLQIWSFLSTIGAIGLPLGATGSHHQTGSSAICSEAFSLDEHHQVQTPWKK